MDSRVCQRPDGTRLRLEGFRLVSRWVTSSEALARFMEKTATNNVSVDDAPDAPQTPKSSPSARQQRAERAAQALKKMGA